MGRGVGVGPLTVTRSSKLNMLSLPNFEVAETATTYSPGGSPVRLIWGLNGSLRLLAGISTGEGPWSAPVPL